MVKSSVNKSSYPKCFQCGSELILISQEIVQPEGTRYPQTNSVYRCSDDDCQKKKDKERADRLKLRHNQAVTQKERMERIQEKRKLIHESKLSEN